MNKMFEQPAEWKFIDDLKEPEQIHVQWKLLGRPVDPEIIRNYRDP